MGMSKFFIERPILANVIAIITILLGAVCLYNLPIAQYPQMSRHDPSKHQLCWRQRRNGGEYHRYSH